MIYVCVPQDGSHASGKVGVMHAPLVNLKAQRALVCAPFVQTGVSHHSMVVSGAHHANATVALCT